MQVLFAGITPQNYPNFNEHSHSEWEIIYYLNGTGTINIGGLELPFEPGDIICQPPFVPHQEFSQDGFKNIYIQVAGFTPPTKQIVIIKSADHPLIHQAFIHVYQEFHMKQQNWNIIVDSLFNSIYHYLIRWNTNHHKNQLVEQFKNTLVSNITNSEFDIELEISKVPLSTDYFRKLFRAETGLTPLQYLIDKRINYAKQLLATKSISSMSIKEISNLAGFSDACYFSRIFKKKLRKNPTEYYEESLSKN